MSFSLPRCLLGKLPARLVEEAALPRLSVRPPAAVSIAVRRRRGSSRWAEGEGAVRERGQAHDRASQVGVKLLGKGKRLR